MNDGFMEQFSHWVNEIALQCGDSPELIKEVLKGLYGPILGECRRGELIIPLLKSTQAYTSADWQTLLAHTLAYAFDRDMTLSEPDESLI